MMAMTNAEVDVALPLLASRFDSGAKLAVVLSVAATLPSAAFSW
jgi:hypothetical protein